jgi:hypothetical protein
VQNHTSRVDVSIWVLSYDVLSGRVAEWEARRMGNPNALFGFGVLQWVPQRTATERERES